MRRGPPATTACARSAVETSARASGRKAAPCGVGCAEPRRGTISEGTSSASSWPTWSMMVEGARSRTREAARKPLASTTARNVLVWSRFNIFDDFQESADGCIHGMSGGTSGEDIDNAARRRQFDVAPDIDNGRTDMRGEDRAGSIAEEARFYFTGPSIARPVFAFEDVGRVACEVTRLKRVGNRRFIHKRAARRVHDAGTGFHARDGRAADDMLGGVRERQSKDKPVRFRDDALH